MIVKRKPIHLLFYLPVILYTLHSFPLGAQGVVDLKELSLKELLEVPFIRLTTGTQKTLAKAPAIASVITTKEMEERGVRYLHEALNFVPGLFVGRSSVYHNPLFIIRGISSETTPHVLFLLNGKPLSTDYQGTLGIFVGNIPVKMIKRIEIIRGPGSALYGANALAGVIDIITKESEDIEGTEVGATGGTFDSYQAWLLHGRSYGRIDAALGFEFTTTHGQRETIDRDIQSSFDTVTGTDASLAPGPMNNMSKSIHSHVDLSYKKWSFEAHNKFIYNQGAGVGLTGSLDPIADRNRSQTDITLDFEQPDLSNGWSYKTEIGYMLAHAYGKAPYLLFPPGSDIPPAGNPFPEGVINDLEHKDDRLSFSASTIYKGISEHTLQAGAFFHYSRFFDIREKKNFDSQTNTPLPGGLTDVTGTDEVFLPEVNRTNYGVYLQDEWSLYHNWELTAGVRFDHFSDFGKTTNPRLALVWENHGLLTTKFLYGHAFRAPSILELHLQNNPFALGNPGLKPEKIDNYELGFDFHPLRNISFRLNLYRFKLRNLITYQVAPNGLQASNSDELIGKGFETEIDMIPIENWKFSASQTYQQVRSRYNGYFFGMAPEAQAKLRTHWYISPEYELNLKLNWADNFKRSDTDSRSAPDGFLTTDLTLHKKNLFSNLDMTLSILNLFDHAYRLPSPGPSPSQPLIPVPGDFPQEGRSFYIGIRASL